MTNRKFKGLVSGKLIIRGNNHSAKMDDYPVPDFNDHTVSGLLDD